MLKGRADSDKTVRVWKAGEQAHCHLTCHTDVVRCKAVSNKDKVSCYNLHLILTQLTYIVPVCL